MINQIFIIIQLYELTFEYLKLINSIVYQITTILLHYSWITSKLIFPIKDAVSSNAICIFALCTCTWAIHLPLYLHQFRHQLLIGLLHLNGNDIEEAYDMEGLSFINELQMYAGWCLDVCPTTPKPSWHSHPKRNGMSEHGGFIKWQTETKWKWSSTYICRTKRLPFKCHQNFSIPIKQWKSRRLPSLSHQLSST